MIQEYREPHEEPVVEDDNVEDETDDKAVESVQVRFGIKNWLKADSCILENSKNTCMILDGHSDRIIRPI